MDLKVVSDGQVVIAEIDGRIDGSSAREFEDRVTSSFPDEDNVLICDLTGVSYVSSAGLRAVLLIAKRLSKRNAAFSVCGLSEPVAEVFRISGFDRIIRVHENRKAALADTET